MAQNPVRTGINQLGDVMETVDQLLDAVKQKHGIKSDYKLAAFTGKTTKTIANYRHARSRPDDATLSELAALADVPQTEIHLMAVNFQADRAANDESRELWKSLAKRLQSGFARVNILILIAIFSIAACALPYWFSLYSVAASANGLYIMLN